MNKIKLLCIVSGAFAISLSARAAKMEIITEDNISNYLTINKQSLIGSNQADSFQQTKQVTLENGLLKNKYTQFYKKVPVYNGLLTSSEINGEQREWFGYMVTQIQDDLKSVTPAFDKTAALNMAKAKFRTLKGKTIINDSLIMNESANLFVRINKKNQAQLVWVVNFYVDGSDPARPYYIFNAENGKLIKSWEGLTTRQAEGPGGNLKTGSYYYGRDFKHLEVSDDCAMKTADVETYDMKNSELGQGTLYRFNCPVNTYKNVNGAYSPLNDAHYFGGIVFAMYRDWYNISPLAGTFKIRVHFGFNKEQAFWNGSQMTFGDGGANTYPFTALDVMAHEVSHGVTEKNSDLEYSKQSGGINEAFSDMAGETAEAFMNQEVGKANDWLGGATIMKNQPAMRYFKNPSADGMSIENASNYNDSLDVHFSSGVYNKAFYTLATKANWGIKKAFGVFLAANQVYWKRDSNFNTAACGVAKAAADLKYEVADVIASFQAVGVNAQCDMPDPQPTPGGEVVLTNGSTVNNIAVQAASEHRYVIKVPRLQTFPFTFDLLYIRAFNATGNAGNSAELFVRYENGGAFTTIKAEPHKNFAGDEFFIINNPAAGSYHILLKGKAAASVNLSAVYGNTPKK